MIAKPYYQVSVLIILFQASIRKEISSRPISKGSPYTEASVDRCFFALLKAEDLQRLPARRFVYKLFHRAPKQTTFDTDYPKEWEIAIRAALARMRRIKLRR